MVRKKLALVVCWILLSLLFYGILAAFALIGGAEPLPAEVKWMTCFVSVVLTAFLVCLRRELLEAARLGIATFFALWNNNLPVDLDGPRPRKDQ